MPSREGSRQSQPVFQICDVNTVLNRIPYKELEELVRSSSARLLPQGRKNDPLDDDVQCLEIEKKIYSKPSDDQVWQEIIKFSGVTCSSEFQKLERQLQGLEQRAHCHASMGFAES